MADMNGANWTPWEAVYLSIGGPGARQWPGWYVCRNTLLTHNDHGMTCTFFGPFKSEGESRAWCDEQNATPCCCSPDVPIEVTISLG